MGTSVLIFCICADLMGLPASFPRTLEVKHQ